MKSCERAQLGAGLGVEDEVVPARHVGVVELALIKDGRRCRRRGAPPAVGPELVASCRIDVQRVASRGYVDTTRGDRHTRRATAGRAPACPFGHASVLVYGVDSVGTDGIEHPIARRDRSLNLVFRSEAGGVQVKIVPVPTQGPIHGIEIADVSSAGDVKQAASVIGIERDVSVGNR